MPGPDAHDGDRPRPDEIRTALDRMTGSDAFRGSPQLVSFLRYVVEATLRGQQERLKGYTIAVEALGRAENFDPQTDPIVRVEAIRLRRAIARYYANGGANDPVVIELPLGTYVPVFRRAGLEPREKPAERSAASPSPAIQRPAHWWRRSAAAALVLLGASIYAGLDFWFDFNTPNPAKTVALTLAAPVNAAPAIRPPSYPVVAVGAFEATGNDVSKSAADVLRARLRDALARFDEIQVVSPPLTETGASVSVSENAAVRYGLTANLEAQDGTIMLNVRLTDAADGRVVYAHTFGRLRHEADPIPGQDALVREISIALARPYGIIESYERARDTVADESYRCLIMARDYWRTYDPHRHWHARECLERSVAIVPDFALGQAALASIVLEEYRSGVNLRIGDAPPLRRAMQAARRAVELKPTSARAYQALANVHFARGDYPLAIEAGERAVMLNPYDPEILADYGGILVALGEQDRGVRMIQEAAGALAARPDRHDFLLFLTAYLVGDHVGAARYAALMASDDYPLGLMARALVAGHRGASDIARQYVERLSAVRPAWRSDYRGELKKYFPAEAISERLARDFETVASVPGQ